MVFSVKDGLWLPVIRGPRSIVRQLFCKGKPTNRFMLDALVDPTVDKQIPSDADDGGIYGSTFTLDTAVAGIGQYDGQVRHCFFRWTGVTISGTINVAYIQCDAFDSGGSPLMKVYGVDEDNPAAPTSAAEFLADPLTTASVDWDGAWVPGWNTSPSLVSIFQELVDSYTISNDAVMVQVKDDGSANGSYNAPSDYSGLGGPGFAAKLHIEYTAAGPPAPKGRSVGGIMIAEGLI